MLSHTTCHLNKPERFRLLILNISFKINNNSERTIPYSRECAAFLHFGLILSNIFVLWEVFLRGEMG